MRGTHQNLDIAVTAINNKITGKYQRTSLLHQRGKNNNDKKKTKHYKSPRCQVLSRNYLINVTLGKKSFFKQK